MNRAVLVVAAIVVSLGSAPARSVDSRRQTQAPSDERLQSAQSASSKPAHQPARQPATQPQSTDENPQNGPCADIASCQSQCDNKIAASCQALAGMYFNGYGGLTPSDERAFEYSSRACELGDAAGCYSVGFAYRTGRGVSRDVQVAFKFFKKGCDGGNLFACNSLGVAYENGDGVGRDLARAFELYRKNCLPQNPLACTNLGLMYLDGRAGTKDEKRAMDLFTQSCAGNDPPGCIELGHLYQSGRVVPRDESHAADLYDKACKMHEPIGCGNLATMYRDGIGVTRNVGRAIGLFNEACDDGDPHSCDLVGQIYATGRDASRDPGRAARLFQQACDQGDWNGCVDLARSYLSGPPEQRQPQAGLDLLTKACDADFRPACTDLAYAYDMGTDVKADNAKALELLKKACRGDEMDDLMGCDRLGYKLQTGMGIAADPAKAFTLYRKSCDPPVSLFGCSDLAYTYIYGVGVPKDESKGISILDQACKLGHPPSCDQQAYNLMNGIGGTRDEDAAARLYLKSCAASAWFCNGLGQAYEYAQGIALNETCAAALYRRSCDEGNQNGCKDLRRMVQQTPRMAEAKFSTECLGGQQAETAVKQDTLGRWALVVGISHYGPAASSAIKSLKYARNDAQDFYHFLLTPQGGAFPKEHVRLLLDEDATSSALNSGMRDFLGQAGPDDLVVIYVAAHGVPDPNHQNVVYLLTYDADLNRLGGTAFDMDGIGEALRKTVQAKRVAVFVDACHAGAVSVAPAGTEARSAAIDNETINRYLTELGRSNKGVAELSASRTNESSYEGEKWGGGHGAFTYYLLEGLHGAADKDGDHIVTFQELIDYVSEKVPAATEGHQHPTPSFGSAQDLDFPLAALPAKAP
jgi:TPR repeat protein